MARYLLCLGAVASVAVLASFPDPADVRVTWNDNRATIAWKEDLADPNAGPKQVPFSVLTGPYLSWLTPTSASVGWEVVAERKLSDKPYASFRADYPGDRI